ncbi:uncharacterized protein LOC142491880 [Ascaphus truei]|uniref:uncharacterized protein LOC142491880 n=1 Tax=Ascaphus truei TaxID=8439 RepID=UPI003F5A48C2
MPTRSTTFYLSSSRTRVFRSTNARRTYATGKNQSFVCPLEELLRAKLLPVVVEGLPGDRDIGIYPSQFPPVAPEGHVSPETEQVSSPGSASSTHLEEHDEEDFDDDDDDDAAAAAAIDTQIQASDHEEVPIETVLPPKRPANTTYDAIVASEGKIVEAENRRHSDLMTVLERMIALQEETVSQLAHLHRVFIKVPKQLQKINTSFEALVVQQTQANYWRMTNVPQFNTSQPGSVHAGQFSPHSSDIHSPGPNVTGQVADIAVQVPDDILPLPSVQIQQQTPTKEATKTKQDTHETDQPSLVQCLPTCSHVSVGTSPVREQSLPKSPVGESLAKSPVGESLPKSPVGESLPKSPVGESLPKSPVGESLATSPVGESLATSPVGEQSLPKSPVAIFQDFVNEIFRDLLGQHVIVYLDAILIYSKNNQEHPVHVKQVLQRLRENKLFAKLEKCNFHQSSTSFLGYIISDTGLAMDPRQSQSSYGLAVSVIS